MADASNKVSPLQKPVLFRRNLKRWFRKQARDLPWRRNRSAYRVVVSEFMLQQTQVTTVVPYYLRWMETFPDWSTLAEADEQTVLKAWEGLGYYSRARNLQRLARRIHRDFGGNFPEVADEMKKLPGIGPYTAGAVASLAFNQPEPILDGNVERVFSRLFNIRDDIKSKGTQQQLWSLARSLLPRKNPGEFNEALMELGALICVPGNPRCLECPVRIFCTTTNPTELPLRKRTETTKLKIDYAFLRDEKKLWLLTPDVPGRWKGFFRLPEFNPETMQRGKTIGTLKFSITRYRILAEVVVSQWKTEPERDGHWVHVSQLDKLPLPSPVRRMLELAGKKP